MKAVVIEEYGDPKVLRLKTVKKPEPGKNQVLIRVAAASVNFADIMTRKGEYHGTIGLPLIPGIDVAGVVERVGAEVCGIKENDMVMAFSACGAYAEYALADEIFTFPVPKGLDLDSAAAIPVVVFTSYNLLHTAGKLSKGETVLIHGAAGGIGTTAIQIARHAGARAIIGTVGSDEKIETAKQAGADIVVNYRKENFSKITNEATGGKGADVILDPSGGNIFNLSIDCLAMYGRIVNFNNASGTGGTVNTKQLHASCRAVLGFSLGTTLRNRPEMIRQTAVNIIPMLETGKIRLWISGAYPIEEASKIHKLIESRKTVGKFLIKP